MIGLRASPALDDPGCVARASCPCGGVKRPPDEQRSSPGALRGNLRPSFRAVRGVTAPKGPFGPVVRLNTCPLVR